MESKKFLCNKVARTYNYYDTFTNESDLLKAMRRDIKLAQVWGTNMVNVRSIIDAGNKALRRLGVSPVVLVGSNTLKQL